MLVNDTCLWSLIFVGISKVLLDGNNEPSESPSSQSYSLPVTITLSRAACHLMTLNHIEIYVEYLIGCEF